MPYWRDVPPRVSIGGAGAVDPVWLSRVIGPRSATYTKNPFTPASAPTAKALNGFAGLEPDRPRNVARSPLVQRPRRAALTLSCAVLPGTVPAVLLTVKASLPAPARLFGTRMLTSQSVPLSAPGSDAKP